jgi:hypothetical protein
MKTNQKYLLLSFLTVLTVTGASLGSMSFAQTANLTCAVSATSVMPNQSAVVSATGGNGTYFWSGPNLNVTNSAGAQFAVSYPVAGTYPITVTSAGMTATCNVVVAGTVSTSSLTCLPASQFVTLGQTATVSASGGNGTYVWSSPDISISNPNGSGFSVNYSTIGVKTMTVTSGGLVATCAINVLAGTVVTPPVTTPGLPNTGGGFGK